MSTETAGKTVRGVVFRVSGVLVVLKSVLASSGRPIAKRGAHVPEKTVLDRKSARFQDLTPKTGLLLSKSSNFQEPGARGTPPGGKKKPPPGDPLRKFFFFFYKALDILRKLPKMHEESPNSGGDKYAPPN